MKFVYVFSFVILLFASQLANSQSLINSVEVETYYVSDANDAQETDGGILEEGSVTYRIYLNLQPGSKIKSLFGNENHEFRITSSENFFNNIDRGESWGFEIPENRCDENTVALDSWLSFGGATDEHWGVLKSYDSDGSFIAGENNSDGMLVNSIEDLGIPLTEQDGLLPAIDTAPSNFFVTGDSPDDIFLDETVNSEFITSNFFAQIDAIGLDSLNNRILIGQLTTTGELEFCLNVSIENPDGNVYNYVGNDADTLLEGEFFSPFLKYPPQCGCIDPNFLEYNPAAVCQEEGSCITPIVFGCMDTLACNYDPLVNLNVQELCCILPDNCEGLDSDILCPGVVGVEEWDDPLNFNLYPNPVQNLLNLNFFSANQIQAAAFIYDERGRIVLEKNISIPAGQSVQQIETINLEMGMYFLRIVSKEKTSIKSFIKL